MLDRAKGAVYFLNNIEKDKKYKMAKTITAAVTTCVASYTDTAQSIYCSLCHRPINKVRS